CTTTGADGRYRLEIPISGSTYYVAAHGDFSMVSESPVLESPPAGEKEVNLLLDDAITPVFAPLQLDMLSATLPAPTAAAGEQALMTRLAVARALRAPADRLARLETRARARAAGATRAAGWVENDLYWAVLDGDVGVRGFHIYRGTDKAGPYTYAGSVNDPYLLFFFDSDPALQSLPRTYYVVTSFAANGKSSSPSRPFLAEPLPQIEATGPADGAAIPRAGAQVTWNAVEGAKSYLVTVFFNAPPSFNMSPIRTPVVYTNGQTAESFADLPPGQYWWSVSAYNTTDPNWATAATYSAYRQVTIQE
ncbi:MAG TPA: hypothetical protein PLZ36_16355, partial [Armatimonadota bacterium]|nr:hypothetical protein [Armatimonadota bacterium]